MAHAHSNNTNNKAGANARDGEVKRATFHEFFTNKGQAQEPSLPANSDLATERHVGHHLEGVPFYGSRGDITGGPESSNRLTGNKRRNSDSFMVSSTEKFRGQADIQDSPLLSKLLRYSGVEQTRRQNVSHSPTDARADTNASVLDRAVPVNIGPSLHYPPRAGQVMPFSYQSPSNRFRDANTGPSVVSQTAADEGSRTGIKGSGILSSMNATRAISGSGRQPSGVLIRSGKQKSGVSITEPESTTTLRHGPESGGGQMTIFYGGQAHVFDSVHRSKADVIMALAGSNGGSWSTNYKTNPTTTPSSGDYRIPSGENDAIIKELNQRPLDKADLHGGSGSGD